MPSPESVQRLLDQKATAWESAKALGEKAIEENRDLTPEEQEQWDRANADIDAANARLGDIAKMTERQKLADEYRDLASQLVREEHGSPIKGDPSDRDMLRAMFKDSDDPARRRGFESRYSDEFLTEHTRHRNPMEKYALATSSSTVATLFAEKVVVYARTLNPTYDLATKMVTRTGGTLTIPRLTADAAAAIVSEAGTITESTPTISSITLGAFGYKALSYWTKELAQDEAVNIDDLIANSAGRQLGLTSGSHFTVGTDTTQPNGFITAASNGGTAAGTPFFLSTDIVGLFYALEAPYRSVGSWQVSNGAISKIRKFTDTNGTFLWQPGLNGAQADTLMGRPIYENPHMATPASASKSVAFGDFAAYHVREVQGVRVEQSDDFLFNTDQTALKVVWRLDGDLPDVAAIKFLVSANS